MPRTWWHRASVYVAVGLLWVFSQGPASLAESEPTPEVVLVLPVRAAAFDSIEAGMRQGFHDRISLRVLLASDVRGRTEELVQAAVASKPALVVPLGTTMSRAFIAAALGQQFPPLLCIAITNPADVLPHDELKSPRRLSATVITDGPPTIYPGTADLITSLLPAVRKLGTVYNPGEQNSLSNRERIAAEATRRGWTLVEKTVNTPEDVERVAEALLSEKPDAIWISKDRVMTAQPGRLIELAHQRGVPVFASDAGTVERFHAVGTRSVSFTELGRYVSHTALDILSGQDIRTLPVSTPEHTRVFLSRPAIEQLGLQIPSAIANTAVFCGEAPATPRSERLPGRASLALVIVILVLIGTAGVLVARSRSPRAPSGS